MQLRLGNILVEQGVLTESQVQDVLREQQRTGEPFGLICERLCDVSPQDVEQAWATQYSAQTRTVDPLSEPVDRRALELITRRQAWQFRVLPLRFDGRELMMVTTRQHLCRALRFATAVMCVPVYLVLAPPTALGEALCRHYPLPGMTPQSINDDFMDRLVA